MGKRKRLHIISTDNPVKDHVDIQSHQQNSYGEDQTINQQSPQQNFQGAYQIIDQQIMDQQSTKEEGRMSAVKDNNASYSTNPQTVEQLKDGLARTQKALNVLFNLVKDHIPNANLSGMLNNLNLEVPDNFSMVPNISPLGNRRASSESNHN